MTIDRETLIYPNVLASTKPGDPESPGTYAEVVTNNHETVMRTHVYWYVPPADADDTEPVLMIEIDDECRWGTEDGTDGTDVKVRIRRNDGLIYEGTRASQERDAVQG